MKIRWRQEKKPRDGDGSEIGVSQSAPASGWTQGTALLTRTMTVGLWAAFACGPLALFATVFLGGSAPAAVASQPVAAASTTQGQAAAEFSQAFTVAWLRAIRGEQESVLDYLSVSQNVNLTLPPTAPVVSEPAVVSVERAEPDAYQVVVSASVALPGQAAIRRFYSVPVVATEAGSLAAASLPSPVAVTPSGASVKYGYPGLVPSSASVHATVSGFVSALLTGDTDVSRFSSPDSEFAAVTPPAYSSISITQLEANRDVGTPDQSPKSGSQLSVMATAIASGPGGDSTVQYALSLEGRDGRWEVSAIDPVPLVTVPTASASPVPTS